MMKDKPVLTIKRNDEKPFVKSMRNMEVQRRHLVKSVEFVAHGGMSFDGAQRILVKLFDPFDRRNPSEYVAVLCDEGVKMVQENESYEFSNDPVRYALPADADLDDVYDKLTGERFSERTPVTNG